MLNKTLAVGMICLMAFSCKDREVVADGVDLNPEETAARCKILSNTRTSGARFDFGYDDNHIITMQGFSDFDTFQYEGVTLVKAVNSRDKSYDVTFDYNTNGQLTTVTFHGKDSQGRAFSNKSTMTYNNKNQISELIFDWPSLDKVQAFINYDNNGNILNISGQYNDRLQNLLVNKSFDDKKSPYKDQKVGQVLSYFMIYGLLVGGDNLTYFINNNNVTASEIDVNNIKRKVGYEYEYNGSDYPKVANHTITENNRIKTATEYFEYKCGS
ncbi:hypothetical protein SAMN06298216_4045 [Spirosomataceae bacterium TFI 002]|nr:hypothetical protein SAMN06298216_4045 [Spirosomataceae bacterium TFI 002]